LLCQAIWNRLSSTLDADALPISLMQQSLMLMCMPTVENVAAAQHGTSVAEQLLKKDSC
jgi:hypothetical protein